MSDTRRDIENDMWTAEHLGMCGTCYYHTKGYCNSNMSECYGDHTGVRDACGEYIPKKGVMV